jgi:isochorismate pyruvate lyase
MRRPNDCVTIDEIRECIDAIDKQVIDLLGKRFHYVKEIVRFKKSEEDVIARKRYDQVLMVRRKWAVEQGLDPDIVEDIYKKLLHYFIEEQKKILKINSLHDS